MPLRGSIHRHAPADAALRYFTECVLIHLRGGAFGGTDSASIRHCTTRSPGGSRARDIGGSLLGNRCTWVFALLRRRRVDERHARGRRSVERRSSRERRQRCGVERRQHGSSAERWGERRERFGRCACSDGRRFSFDGRRGGGRPIEQRRVRIWWRGERRTEQRGERRQQ